MERNDNEYKAKAVYGQLPPRKIVPRLGLRFGLGLGLVFGLGAIFIEANCPRISENKVERETEVNVNNK